MEWVAEPEREEAALEEADGGLERRRRGKGGFVENRAPPQEEEAANGGGERSVYFDGDRGVNSIDDIAGIEVKEVNHFIDDNNNSLVNGNAGSRINKLDNPENIPEEIPKTKNVRLENGSNSYPFSEGYVENEITTELKIEENVQVRLVKKSKLGPEIDLEKILEEQETHDLYCPNCNSCITKRVILRKRKRTIRDIQPEAPPAKLQQVQHDHDGTAASAELTEISHDREPDVFRCLSCFSFFIPTDTGFNIFRIFGKREETDNLQTSQQLPVKDVNWISSIFKPVKNIKKSGDAGLALPIGSATISRQQMGESSLNIQTYPTKVVSDVSLEVSGMMAGLNDTGASLNIESDTVDSADPFLQEKQSSLSAAAIGVPKPGEGHSSIGDKDAGVSLTIGSDIVDSADPSFKEKQSSLALAAIGVAKPGEGHSSIGDKDADKMHRQSFISNGEQAGGLDKNVMQSSLTKTRCEGLNLQESQIMTGKDGTDKMPWGYFINDGEQADGLDKNVVQSSPMQAYSVMPVPVTPAAGESISITGQDEDAAYIYQYNTTTTSISGVIVHDGQVNVGQKLNDALRKNDAGEDIILPVSIINPTFAEAASEIIQNIHGSVPQATLVLTHDEAQIYLGEQHIGEVGRKNDWDVLKSIVYGGLIESITSLSVVSSAAGSDADTINVVSLGLANLIGGLLVIAHDLSELSTPEQATDSNGEPVGRYWELLGRKANFRLHAIVAILTYVVAGLLPPIIYGFSFRKSDNKEYKLIAIASASLLCIALLAIGKAHVRPQKGYIKSLSYYLGLGVSASGLSYVAGVMIHRLLEQLDLYNNSEVAPAPPSIMYRGISSMLEQWASS